MNGRLSRTSAAVCIGGAVILEALIALLTLLAPDRSGYGAPLAVGGSSGMSGAISLGTSSSSFSIVLFLIDVAITVLPLLVLARSWGAFAAAVGVVGSIVAFAAQVWLYEQMSSGQSVAAGFPIPIASRTDQGIHAIGLWLDCILGALVLGSCWALCVAGIAARRNRKRMLRNG